MSVSYLKFESAPNFARMTNLAFGNFMQRFYDDIPKDEEEDPEEDGPQVQMEDARAAVGASAISVSPELLEKMKETLASYLRLTDESRSNVETASLEEADAARDETLSFALNHIENSMKSPIAETREAATHLYNKSKAYKGATRYSVNDETQAIYGFLNDMEREEFAAYITTLVFQPVLDALRKQNDRYAQLVREREEEVKKLGKMGKAKEFRAELEDLYEEITDRAFATNLLNSSPEATDFIETMNVRIKDAKKRLKWEESHKDGEEMPDTETPDTETPGTDTPSTEDPSTETPDTENPSGENPDTETPDTENPDEPSTEEPDDRPVVQ